MDIEISCPCPDLAAEAIERYGSDKRSQDRKELKDISDLVSTTAFRSSACYHWRRQCAYDRVPDDLSLSRKEMIR
jgi:aspartyl-tRNA synthetase